MSEEEIEKEIQGNNILIAKFLSWEYLDAPFDDWYVNKVKLNSDLKFNSSFEWLMPVVEKIEKDNYGFKMCRKVVEIYYDDTKEVILKTKESCRLDSLYLAVVQFIKWHNEKK